MTHSSDIVYQAPLQAETGQVGNSRDEGGRRESLPTEELVRILARRLQAVGPEAEDTLPAYRTS